MRDATERTARFDGDGRWIPVGLGRMPATLAVAALSVVALVSVFLTSTRHTVFAISSASAGVDAAATCAGASGVQAVALTTPTSCADGPAVRLTAGTGAAGGSSQDTQQDSALAPKLPSCAGDGTSGDRIEFYYAYFRGQQNRIGMVRKNLIHIIEQANDIVYLSARMHHADQSLRVVTDRNCVPLVNAIELPDADADSFAATVRDSHLRAHNRKYVLFTDSARFCGVGTMGLDDRPGSDNANNSGPSWARVDSDCWTPRATARAVFRMLGAVQKSAPHYTTAGHCAVGYDLICRTEAPASRAAAQTDDGGPALGTCADPTMVERLDCSGEDYYNPAPLPGSYLASHWNTANSSFLYGSRAPAPVRAAEDSAVIAAGQP